MSRAAEMSYDAISKRRKSPTMKTNQRSVMRSGARTDQPLSDFDAEFDVVVVGYGYAGGISAVEAADAGAKVLLIEKAPVPGGISICSYGNARCAKDKDLAFQYLIENNDLTQGF